MLNNIFSFYLIERKINFILFFKFKFKNDIMIKNYLEKKIL